jgi:hypothetical protein
LTKNITTGQGRGNGAILAGGITATFGFGGTFWLIQRINDGLTKLGLGAPLPTDYTNILISGPVILFWFVFGLIVFRPRVRSGNIVAGHKA